jgi:CBS domain-containing protein
MAVAEAVRLLLQHEISGAPVVSEEGELLGVFSEFDCLKALANEEFYGDYDEQQLVGDLMCCERHTIEPTLDLFRIAQTFVSLNIRRLPVLSEGKLVGQVSRRDVLRALDKLESRLHDRKEYPDYPSGRRPIP